MSKFSLINLKNIFTGKLVNKMIFSYSSIVCILIVVLTFFSYNNSVKVLKEEFIWNNIKNMTLINRTLDNYINLIDELSLTPRKFGQFMYALQNQPNDYNSQKSIEIQIKNLFYSRKDIEKVYFYMPQKGKLYYISRSNSSVRIVNDNTFISDTILKTISSNTKYRYIEPVFDNENYKENSFILFHRSLIDIITRQPIAVISILLNDIHVEEIVTDTYEKEGIVLSILNEENIPLYINDKQFLGISHNEEFTNNINSISSSGFFQWNNQNEQYLVVCCVTEDLKWKLVKLIPLNVITKSAQHTKSMSLVIGTVFLILFICIIIMISGAITNSLRKFAKNIDDVGEGNFHTLEIIKGTDEITRLSQKFNSMVEKINQLINEEFIIKINEKNARLKALEAQINPHFLYNSLQAISTKSLVHGMTDVSEMVETLAHSLRYCIKKEDLVKVRSEIEHIKNYLVLQRARFGNRLTDKIEIQEAVYDAYIPKLSIQTIVENSIIHGLEKMSGTFMIEISAIIDDGNIIIEVLDNGPGIPIERLNDVIKEMKDENLWLNPNGSIGLKNVWNRLNILYGKQAVLEIISKKNYGTKVKIILPISMKGGISHVYSLDN